MARFRIKPGKRLTPFVTGKCKIMQTGMKISEEIRASWVRRASA